MSGAGGIPVSSANKSAMATEWSTGLCDCFSDVNSCCLTCWCPCVTFGRMSEIIDEGSTSCGGNTLIFCVLSSFFTPCTWLYTCTYRSRLRGKYRLEETPCNDCCVHYFCISCAMCQEYRELKNRGFDMHIGWQGNVERQNRGVAMAPMVEGGMNR